MPNWKKLVVSGSDATLNSLNINTFLSASDISADSLNVTSITGSLLGTASNATLLDGTSSVTFATTGSNTFEGTQTISGSLLADIDTLTLTGSIGVLGSITASNFTGSFRGDGSNLTNVPVDFEEIAAYDFTFTSSSLVSVTHSLNTSNPFVQVYDESNEQVIPQTIRIVNLDSVEVVFPTVTSGKVIVAKGGHVITVGGLTFEAFVFTSQSSVNVTHSLNTNSPIVQVYDSNNEQVIPQKIQVLSSSSVLVEFPIIQSGRVALSKGGPVPVSTGVSGSFSGSFNSSGHFLPSETEQFDLGSANKKWRDLYLSGSTIYLGTLQLKDEGGSFTVKTDNGDPVSQTIDGTLTTNQISLNAGNSFNIITTASVTTGIFDETALIDPTISPSQYSGTNIEYVIQRPGASRSGTIMTSWSGSSVSYTDFSATGVGDTSDLTFDVVFANDNIRLRAYSAGSGSGDWKIHTLFKLFPNIT